MSKIDFGSNILWIYIFLIYNGNNINGKAFERFVTYNGSFERPWHCRDRAECPLLLVLFGDHLLWCQIQKGLGQVVRKKSGIHHHQRASSATQSPRREERQAGNVQTQTNLGGQAHEFGCLTFIFNSTLRNTFSLRRVSRVFWKQTLGLFESRIGTSSWSNRDSLQPTAGR